MLKDGIRVLMLEDGNKMLENGKNDIRVLIYHVQKRDFAMHGSYDHIR